MCDVNGGGRWWWWCGGGHLQPREAASLCADVSNEREEQNHESRAEEGGQGNKSATAMCLHISPLTTWCHFGSTVAWTGDKESALQAYQISHLTHYRSPGQVAQAPVKLTRLCFVLDWMQLFDGAGMQSEQTTGFLFSGGADGSGSPSTLRHYIYHICSKYRPHFIRLSPTMCLISPCLTVNE